MAHSQRWLVILGAFACAVGVAVALSPKTSGPALTSASHTATVAVTTPVANGQKARMTQAVVNEANTLSLSISHARDAAAKVLATSFASLRRPEAALAAQRAQLAAEQGQITVEAQQLSTRANVLRNEATMLQQQASPVFRTGA